MVKTLLRYVPSVLPISCLPWPLLLRAVDTGPSIIYFTYGIRCESDYSSLDLIRQRSLNTVIPTSRRHFGSIFSVLYAGYRLVRFDYKEKGLLHEACRKISFYSVFLRFFDYSFLPFFLRLYLHLYLYLYLHLYLFLFPVLRLRFHLRSPAASGPKLRLVFSAQSRICPSVEMVTTCHGMNFPLF